MARRVRITFDKIRVHTSEDYDGVGLGVGGEAGDSAEWKVFLRADVNGRWTEFLSWERNEVTDGSVHIVDKDVAVELTGPLSIEVYGFEWDDSSGSDGLPSKRFDHPPEPGWDRGGTRYKRLLEADDYEYTVYYTIVYLDPPPPQTSIAPGHGVLVDTRYSGLWNAGTKRREHMLGVTAQELNERAGVLWPQGGRLEQLQPYTVGRQVRYNAIWGFSGIGQLWNIDCDEVHFRKTTDENWNWARPHQVTPFVLDGRVRYAVLWNAGQHGQVWNPNIDDAGFRGTTGDTWSWARPHQVYAFVVNGAVRYSCLWNAGQHGQVWNPNCSEAEAWKIGGDNWSWGRAHQMQPFKHNGQLRYSVLWNAGQQGQLWNINCDERQVEQNSKDSWSWGRATHLLSYNA